MALREPRPHLVFEEPSAVENRNLADVRYLALDFHNNFRCDHGAPSLKLDLNLCEKAEAYAICLANGGKVASSENSALGRNVHVTQQDEGTIVYSDKEAVCEAVTTWYSHWREYSWINPLSSSSNAKQFSQIVWKSSKTFGVGVASRKENGVKGFTVVVALYSPGRNDESDEEYRKNVLRHRGGRVL